MADPEVPHAVGATRIEALSYRSLRYVSQSLRPLQVLVGPNASGKSNFLDVLGFLGDIVRGGIEAAVHGEPRLGIVDRAPDARHLTWMRRGDRFELAVEVALPPRLLPHPGNPAWRSCRYELAVEVDGPLRIGAEALWLKPSDPPPPPQPRLVFPGPAPAPETIVRPLRRQAPQGWKKVLSRGEQPEDLRFTAETTGWNSPFKVGTSRAALASLPDDRDRFPAATWFRDMLADAVQRLALSSAAMRRPSPPGLSHAYLPDGSNLPHVVHSLERDQPDRFRMWIGHLQEAWPDIASITTRERDEDRHRYVVLSYSNGLEAPSWVLSDGTLRLLALTLLAYVPSLRGIYLVEEPENGIHPAAIETVFQSLSSVYDAQVLLATHPPGVVALADREQVLCFGKTADGATDIVSGPEHPRLAEGKASADLGTLLAAGVLS